MDMNFNDMLQWGAIIAILIIVATVIIKKIIRLRRRIKSGEPADCGCGSCTNCPKFNHKKPNGCK